METTFIRAFVLMLSLTGFGASAISAHNSGTSVKTGHPTGMDTGGPAVCLPSDPTHCGMDLD